MILHRARSQEEGRNQEVGQPQLMTVDDVATGSNAGTGYGVSKRALLPLLNKTLKSLSH